MNDPHKLLEAVHDEASFVAYVRALGEDWEDERRKEAINPSSPWSPGANGWQNGSIGQFLEAACAWWDSTKGNPPLMSVTGNSWQRAANILYAGKIYE